MTTQGRTGRRVGIVVAAVAAAAFYVLAFFVWIAGRIGCEDAEEPDWNTVRCDSERGSGWTTFEGILWLLGAVVLVAALVWALKRATFTPVIAAAAVVVAVVVAVFQIEGKELSDKQVPELSDVSVVNDECTAPCSSGFKVRFTTDIDAAVHLSIGPANYDDIGDRQYRDLLNGSPTTDGSDDVDAGSHEITIGGEIVNPPDEAGPLPPGKYKIEVYARPQDAGNQEEASSETSTFAVTINP